MCSSPRDDHKRSKRITDSTDATDLFFHGLSPLLSPLGDDRLGIDYLSFKLAIRNPTSPRGDKRGLSGIREGLLIAQFRTPLSKKKYFQLRFIFGK